MSTLSTGDKVEVKRPGKKGFVAKVVKAGTAKAKVQKENGTTKVVPIKYLTKIVDTCKTAGCTRPARKHGYCKICFRKFTSELPRVPRKTASFDDCGLEWNEDRSFFRFSTAGKEVEFYGWFRKTKFSNSGAMCYAVDIFAKRDGHEASLPTVVFTRDPRPRPRKLSRMILKAATKWYVESLNGNVAQFDRLQKIAAHPRLHIKRMETLDRIILKLKEFRDVAIRAGGTRLFELRGDNDTEPTVHVVVNLTLQALALDGKVPSLYQGAVFDAAARGGLGRESSRKRKGVIANQPDESNVAELVRILKTSTDQAERRKIRATLRKMGHRGGAKGVR